jgi:hypothetical protein
MFVPYQYHMFVPYQYPMFVLYQYPTFVPYQYSMLVPYQYTMVVPYQYTMFVPSQYSVFECHRSFKAYVLQGSCWSVSAFVTVPCISTDRPIIPSPPPHRCWKIIDNYDNGGESTVYCSPCRPNISDIVAGLLTGWLVVWFVTVESDFLFSRTSSLAWGPPSLFLIHTGMCFPRVKQLYCRFDLSAPLMLALRTSGTTYLLLLCFFMMCKGTALPCIVLSRHSLPFVHVPNKFILI